MSVRDILMGAAGNSAVTPDPNFKNVTLLLSGDGTNGAQNNTFLDSSTNNFTITRNGNTTQGSFSPYGNLWSANADANGNYFTSGSSSALGFGTGDFTIEFFIFVNRFVDNQFVIDFRPSGNGGATQPLLWITTAGALIYFTAGGVRITSSNGVVPLGTWTHVAVTKTSGTTRVFANGSQVGSFSDSYDYGSSARFVNGTFGDAPGATNANGGAISGYISNLRILKGTALYTGSYTVPTANLTAIANTSVLTFQSNRFVDNSSNNISITPTGTPSVQRFSPFNPTAPYSTSVIGGSGYFDGSGDYLSIARNSAFTPTGDFTYELWVYPTATPDATHGAWLGGLGESGDGSQFSWTLKILNNFTVDFYIRSSNIDHLTTATVRLNQWNYIAVSRQGTGSNNLLITINGQNQTYSDSGSLVGNGTPQFTIGADQNGDEAFLTGWVSGARFINGTGYTSIPVPTTPPTAITNTALLANFINAGIPDLAMQNNLETVGNAQVSTSVKKYGTGSLAFDGTGDYLVAFSSAPLGTANATIEFWVYPTSSTVSYRALVDTRSTTATNTGFGIFQYGRIIEVFGNGSKGTSASNSLTINEWNHVAITRSSGTCQIYINGTASGSSFTYSDNMTSQKIVIGQATSGTAFNFVGNIDDVRITLGVVRYSATFTPPAALPNQ